jgi:hypothetical protein
MGMLKLTVLTIWCKINIKLICTVLVFGMNLVLLLK